MCPDTGCTVVACSAFSIERCDFLAALLPRAVDTWKQKKSWNAREWAHEIAPGWHRLRPRQKPDGPLGGSPGAPGASGAAGSAARVQQPLFPCRPSLRHPQTQSSPPSHEGGCRGPLLFRAKKGQQRSMRNGVITVYTPECNKK
jgi:hypothetical protein